MLKFPLEWLSRWLPRRRRVSAKEQNVFLTDGATLEVGKNVSLSGAKLFISKGSRLIIGDDVKIQGRIDVENSTVVISRGCMIDGAKITAQNGAFIDFGEGVVFLESNAGSNNFVINSGTITVGSKTRFLGCDVLVRFGGKLVIGGYSGFGSQTEIRCEHQISIGSYCLVSYGVSIFDTNTHSTCWRERRARIIEGYPFGPSEKRASSGKPVFLGDDVWIGKNVILSKGCRIGDRSIVGMGAVVGGVDISADSRVVSPRARIL